MIEVEIRGRLDEEGYKNLKGFLEENGEHVESHEREMYMLYDYPGFSHDPLERLVDIRLRNTNGECEIMVKRKMSENNVARGELSLKLVDSDLEKAKEVMKSLGFLQGLKMQRAKDVYRYQGVEWSVVKAPKGYYYFEAECIAQNEAEIEKIYEYLTQKANEMSLKVLSPNEMQEFIYMLDRDVNEVVDF